MKATTLPILLCGIGLIIGPAAMAAGSSDSSSTHQQSVTSGPAAGTAVKPNATPYKNSTSAEANGAANGAGAPGVAAKPGTEAGPTPHKAGSKS